MKRKLINVLLGVFLAMPASLCPVQAEEPVSEEEAEIQAEEESQEIPAEETIEEQEEISEEAAEETETAEELQEEDVEEEPVEEIQEETTAEETAEQPENGNSFIDLMQELNKTAEEFSEGEITVKEKTTVHELDSSNGVSQFINTVKSLGKYEDGEYTYQYINSTAEAASFKYDPINETITLIYIVLEGPNYDGSNFNSAFISFDPDQPNAYVETAMVSLNNEPYVAVDQIKPSGINYVSSYNYRHFDLDTNELDDANASTSIKNRCNNMLNTSMTEWDYILSDAMGIGLYDLGFTNAYALSITPDEISVNKGESVKVKVNAIPSSVSAGTITWSYPKSFVAVNGTGSNASVFGIAEGSGLIIAKASNGATAVAGFEVIDTGTERIYFEDVDDPTKSFFEAVYWAVDEGITKGTSATTFSPQDPCTRGQFVTFLWRAKGCPEPKTTKNPFTDVQTDKSYYKAVLWALENKITTGTSATKFSPGSPCTRGQVATFLYRAAGSPAAKGGKIFADVKSGLSYSNAVNWAADKKITTGTDATHFSPDKTCTRAQCVTFLMRMFRDSINLQRGWTKVDGKWKYIDENDNYVTGWRDILNSTYYFNASGFMKTGWQGIDSETYYFNSDGQMLRGWQKLNNKWHYFDKNGVMLKGWQTISGKKYHFTDTGVMQTGWQQIYNPDWDEIDWYYFDGSGAMAKGWKKINNKWYYFNEYMYYSGWYEIGPDWYCFKDSGEMITGWGSFTGEDYFGDPETIWVYCDSNGKGHTGWIKSGDDWYYFDEGEMYTGLNYIGSKLYAFLQDGRMVKNRFYIPLTWERDIFDSPYYYHFDADGKGTTGWVREKSGREIYYINGTGKYHRYRY